MWRLFALLIVTTVAQRNDFAQYMAKYEKKYSDEQEFDARFAAFQSNMKFVQETNSKNLTYRLEMNEFADLTQEEFRLTHFGFNAPSKDTMFGGKSLGTVTYSGGVLADSIDWVAKGAVNAVKNQGQCGSCWAFSAVCSLEGAWFLATGKLVRLSEQEMVDCDKTDNGCGGGLMDNAFRFWEDASECSEDSYPYEAQRKSCRKVGCDKVVPTGSVTGYHDVTANNEQALMQALMGRPVSVAIEADRLAFQLYKGGVLTDHGCGTQLDHGVVAVGYGTDASEGGYWKVRNSWGGSWGEHGYVRLGRGGSVGPAGECGILQMASYPLVSTAINV